MPNFPCYCCLYKDGTLSEKTPVECELNITPEEYFDEENVQNWWYVVNPNEYNIMFKEATKIKERLI